MNLPTTHRPRTHTDESAAARTRPRSRSQRRTARRPHTRRAARGRTLRVVLAGGGTAGHLFPGLAVLDALADRHPGPVEAWLFGTGRTAERRGMAGTRVRQERLPAPRPPRRPTGWPRFALQLLRALAHTRSRLRAIEPDLVIGLGSYAAVAPGLAAHRLGIPLLLLEQNAVPGRAVRLLAPRAERVFVPWEETAHALGATARCEIAGNPVRPAVRTRPPRAVARRRLGLSPAAPVLLVAGGSQGAHALNRAVAEALPAIVARRPDAELIHLAGDDDLGALRARYRAARLRVHLSPFLRDMPSAYAAADFALCRAGGSTIAELQVCGLPAALVPYPHAAGDHQRANARAAARTGAFRVLEQHDLARGGMRRAIAWWLEAAHEGEQQDRSVRRTEEDAAVRIARRIGEIVTP
ncbi:MAG: UDP-N-acetylglucosamine--N-acetylmuramyl-(pentapeptide) pyrophosphoryl-undecaprenol N-acetylglucosamine transferase [Planctomycetota bacterium]|nr:MAG: UDP-N-acetylglucosamine--N-acetylmuramyl-(pentapeptide) pyrophosphoryl-undecaprenol N-acetylglucosamine transferase [Planctomycetota bacterium]